MMAVIFNHMFLNDESAYNVANVEVEPSKVTDVAEYSPAYRDGPTCAIEVDGGRRTVLVRDTPSRVMCRLFRAREGKGEGMIIVEVTGMYREKEPIPLKDSRLAFDPADVVDILETKEDDGKCWSTIRLRQDVKTCYSLPISLDDLMLLLT